MEQKHIKITQVNIEDIQFPKCTQSGHQRQQVSIICVDQACQEHPRGPIDNVFCVNCQFQGKHKGHDQMLLDQFLEKIKSQFQSQLESQNATHPFIDQIEELVHQAKLLKDSVNKLLEELDQIKSDITKTLQVDPVDDIFSYLSSSKNLSHEELGARVSELKRLVSVEEDKVVVKPQKDESESKFNRIKSKCDFTLKRMQALISECLVYVNN